MFELKGKIEDNLSKVVPAVQKAAFKNFGHAAASIAKDAKSTIRTTRTKHAPYHHPPHTRGQSGKNLRGAIHYDVKNDNDPDAVIGPVGSEIGRIGELNEFGGDYMGLYYGPRPFMEPALERALPRIAGIWEGSLETPGGTFGSSSMDQLAGE